MHILFLTHYFPPEVNAPASRTYEHAKRWVTNPNVKITVVTNHPNHPNGVLYPGYKNRWISREEKDGIQVIRVKTFLAPNAGFIRRTLNYLFFMVASIFGSFKAGKPDLVVATSPQFFCAVGGYLVSRLKRRPFIFELRDIWPDSIVTVGAMKANLAIRFLEKVELFLYRKAAHIVAVTDAFKSNLTGRGVPSDKISVIKNGVDLTLFQPRPASQQLARELGVEGKFVVSYIGTIGMAHAVDKIVEAAQLLRDNQDIAFLIVGEGAHKQKVKDLATSLQLPNLRVLPGVSKKELLDYYALTDLNLVTLQKKPLFQTVIPSKIFEIMGMARPILTSVDGESRSIIEQSGAGIFIEPENPQLMAQTLLQLSQDRPRLVTMGQSGCQYVRTHFSRDQAAADFLRLFHRLTSR